MKEEAVSRGILGLGAVSTAFYVKEIHRKYQEQNEEFSTSPFLLYQIDFQEINPFLPDQFSVLIPKLKTYLKRFSDMGISKLLIPNITLHETLDQMVLPFEIFHPAELTTQYCKENDISQIYLFGTLYTMNSEYLRLKFLKNGITVLKPSETDQIWIDDFRKTIYRGDETAAEINFFQNLIMKYSVLNSVVVACTELSLFSVKNTTSCIDMADLQIEAFLKKIG